MYHQYVGTLFSGVNLLDFQSQESLATTHLAGYRSEGEKAGRPAIQAKNRCLVFQILHRCLVHTEVVVRTDTLFMFNYAKIGIRVW